MAHHSESIQLTPEKYVMTGRTRSILIGLMVLGVILTVIGIFQVKNGAHDASHHAMVSTGHESGVDAHHAASWTTRVWANLLLNGFYSMIIAFMGTLIVSLQYVTNAGWATGIKRIPEAMGMYMLIGLVFVLIAIGFGGHELYHWMHDGIKDPGAANFDHAIKGKSGFLNKGFLYVGFPVIVIIFFVFHYLIRKASHREDVEGGLAWFKKSERYSAAFMVIFAFAFSIISWLVIMSLEPHWYSTIYAIYTFAIAFVSGFTVIAFIVLFLKAQGYLSFINGEHIHDLGKFMFAFTIFWTYIWVAQYLLIWYANIPEESKYFYDRQDGNGGIYHFQFWFNLVLCFLIPFLGLMTRNAKRNPVWLYIIGSVILIGHWNDMYLLVMPGTVKEAAGIGLLEIGMPVFFVGLFTYTVLHFLQKVNLFPINHPYLEESVRHDVGV